MEQSTPTIQDLPHELRLYIVQNFNFSSQELVKVSLVNKEWKSYAEHEDVWLLRFKNDFPEVYVGKNAIVSWKETYKQYHEESKRVTNLFKGNIMWYLQNNKNITYLPGQVFLDKEGKNAAIFLGDNKLTALPESIGGLSLITLAVQNNDLRYLPSSLQKQVHTQTLYINKNLHLDLGDEFYNFLKNNTSDSLSVTADRHVWESFLNKDPKYKEAVENRLNNGTLIINLESEQ